MSLRTLALGVALGGGLVVSALLAMLGVATWALGCPDCEGAGGLPGYPCGTCGE